MAVMLAEAKYSECKIYTYIIRKNPKQLLVFEETEKIFNDYINIFGDSASIQLGYGYEEKPKSFTLSGRICYTLEDLREDIIDNFHENPIPLYVSFTMIVKF